MRRGAARQIGPENTILPFSDLIQAIGRHDDHRQQRSSPLFVAGTFDPSL
jgi:hypothetical protein